MFVYGWHSARRSAALRASLSAEPAGAARSYRAHRVRRTRENRVIARCQRSTDIWHGISHKSHKSDKFFYSRDD